MRLDVGVEVDTTDACRPTDLDGQEFAAFDQILDRAFRDAQILRRLARR
jgi:hypothetical protein